MAFRKNPQRLRVREINADEVSEQDETHLGMPNEVRRRNDRLLHEMRRAENISSHAKWIGNESQKPRQIGEEQCKVVTDVVDEGYRY